MSFSCCSHTHETFTGQDPVFRRVLIIVICLNALMCGLELIMGAVTGSSALLADALDFFADSVTYTLSLVALSYPPRTRAMIAMAKGWSLVFMGLFVLAITAYHIITLFPPHAPLMGATGLAAFSVNILSVGLLYRFQQGDANIRSVWLCSRNDAIGNLAVVLAAAGVFGLGSAWPDILVAALMAGLFLQSAFLILQQSVKELRIISATPT